MILLVNRTENPTYYQTEGAACFDIAADEAGTILPGEWKAVRTGLFIENVSILGRTQCLMIYSRSGLALKNGVAVLNSPGIVDQDYKGEVLVILMNHHKSEPFYFEKGDRIAQGKIEEVDRVGYIPIKFVPRSGGFGSTND